MDKTLMIDGRPVVFRKTAGTARRYQMQFGREFTDDLSKILALKDELKSEDESIRINAVLGMDTGWMYDFAYIMAQQADPTIRDELHWLDSFEEMNIFSVVLELLPMILAEGKPSPKNV